jgi:hypothetical protein
LLMSPIHTSGRGAGQSPDPAHRLPAERTHRRRQAFLAR